MGIEIQKRVNPDCRIHLFLLVYNLYISRILPGDILVLLADIPTFAFRIENVDITGILGLSFLPISWRYHSLT